VILVHGITVSSVMDIYPKCNVQCTRIYFNYQFSSYLVKLLTYESRNLDISSIYNTQELK